MEPVSVACYERIDIVSADAACLSRDNCDLVAESGAIPRISRARGYSEDERRGVFYP